MTELSQEQYKLLRDQGLEAAEADRMEEAFGFLDQAWQIARQLQDERLVDRAFCNRSAVVLELGIREEVIGELRRILTANADEISCRLAAYTLARAYELRKEYKKGMFYARIARDRAYQLDKQDWIASSHNQVGNFFIAESFFREAREEYCKALELIPEEAAIRRAVLHYNLGYCLVLERQYSEAYRLLFRSVRTLRRHKARSQLALAHLDLAYAHLELARYRDAMRHSSIALGLAEKLSLDDTIKNALFLLGQATCMAGDDEAQARQHFQRLQARYYPDSPHLADFLMAVDVRQVVNLKA